MVSRISSMYMKVYYKLFRGYICKIGKDLDSLFGALMRKPDNQAENRRSRGGTEGTQFSIQGGLHSILSLSSHALQVFGTVFFWSPSY